MILDRYLLRQFSPVFFMASGMFVFLILLIDLFANLPRYLTNDAALAQILSVSIYYLPKAFAYSIPISLLFAAAHTLGELYARNELTSIFCAGIPFYRFCVPLFCAGIVAAFFSFFFEDRLVIPTIKTKNELSRSLMGQSFPSDDSDIVIKTNGGKTLYSVDYYDDVRKALSGISIVEQDENGKLLSLVRSSQAEWTGDHWALSNPLEYRWEGGLLRSFPLDLPEQYNENPDSFRRRAVRVEELKVKDAALLVADLKTAGLPFAEAQADYYHRFSFSTVSLVVIILSAAMGGRFKKNILLMSLLTSLISAVVFYVIEMVTMAMARTGYLPAILGAWFPVLGFIALGIFLLRSVRT
ncbi:MAG: LptF/LptG family permease [Spirochaetaceae bacterium]|jgi:lipopolysaccharide export system permease protein|nr:LptF/LptG family permease [Spirochaetaceae bacterium]